MAILIEWDDVNPDEEGHRVYVSATSMDPDNLPAPTAELGADVTSYSAAVDETQDWYVIVSAFKGGVEKKAAQVAFTGSSGGATGNFLHTSLGASGGVFGDASSLAVKAVTYDIEHFGSTARGLADIPAALQTEGVRSLSGGLYHYLGLSESGNLYAWGDATWNQVSGRPTPTANIIGIAAGYQFSAYLQDDGWVFAWGDTATTVPASIQGSVVKIVAGQNHLLALLDTGEVAAWENGTDTNSHGQTSIPAELSGQTVVDIHASRYSSFALLDTGQIIAWGGNDVGETGTVYTGSDVARFPVGSCCGAEHVMAIIQSGAIVSWGLSDDGRTSPPAGLGVVDQVCCGRTHSLAVDTSGTLWAWGDNTDGQAVAPSVTVRTLWS